MFGKMNWPFAILMTTSIFFSSHLQAAPQKVVAQVNAEKITLAEFNEEYDRVEAETINPPPKEIFLEDLVRYEIGAQEAEKQKIDQDPIVKKEI
ncbi:MAG: hypothetical protein KDD25_08085, partial [Bdellovibrionales bacterium]|nr:hypothetical protein [Bdellovibrionales bacterium]